MSTVLWGALSLVGVLVVTALGDLVSEEIRGWLDRVPRAVLWLAARQLDQDQREAFYRDAWLPDLEYHLRGDESRPVTRLVRGTVFAFGFFIAARHVPPVQGNDTLPPALLAGTAITASAAFEARASLVAGGVVAKADGATAIGSTPPATISFEPPPSPDV